MRPRVVFLTPSLGMGGAERWVVEMCRSLRQCDVAGVWPIAPANHPDLVAEVRAMGVPIIVAGERISGDVIISWGVPEPRKMVGPTHMPIIAVAHSGPWPEAPADFFETQAWQANHLVAVSEYAATAFPKRYQPHVNVIYNGLPKERVAVKQGGDVWRERWGVRPGQKVVLQLGRLSAEKRPEKLLSAARFLSDEWVVAFVGDGVLRDDDGEVGAQVRTPSELHRAGPGRGRHLRGGGRGVSPVGSGGDAAGDDRSLAGR